MAKKSIALNEIDFKKLFPNAVSIVSRNRNKRQAGFFEPSILAKETEALLNGKPLDINAFYDTAKIGKKNDDIIHKEYYVKRAVKIEAVKQIKKIDLLKDNVFNEPAITASLNKMLNNEAIQSLNVGYANNVVKAHLLIDAKNLFR